MSEKQFSDRQMDVLKEIGNICSGNATVALSQILGKKISLETTEIKVLGINEFTDCIHEESQSIIGIIMDIIGTINGRSLLVFSATHLVPVQLTPIVAATIPNDDNPAA